MASHDSAENDHTPGGVVTSGVLSTDSPEQFESKKLRKEILEQGISL